MKKAQTTKEIKSKEYVKEIFNSSDTEDSIKIKDSLSLERSSSVRTDDMLCKLEGNQPRRMSELRSYSEYLDAYDQNQNKIGPIKSSIQTDLVGFGLLPDQVYNKTIRRGFEFCLMVAGASGLGKSTLVNSMFLTDIYATDIPAADSESEQTLRVEPYHTVLEENGESFP